jgi:acyl-coenzyme A thioesterase PaaI-like protein
MRRLPTRNIEGVVVVAAADVAAAVAASTLKRKP